MRYLVKERIFTFADKFNIEDQDGNPQYEVVGEIFTCGNKLRMYDLSGREAIYIEQKLFRFLPEYNIYKNDQLLAKIKKELTFFKPHFTIESSYGRLEIQGDLFRHEFNILRNDRAIAWISKRWVALSDTYAIDIEDGEDNEFILSIVITLDQICYDGKRQN